MQKLLKVAAAQFAPSFLNKKETLEKACDVIARAGKEGVRLVVFPEVFIPGYPDWVWLVPNNQNAELNELYVELVQNAVSIPDETTAQLCSAAKKSGVNVVIGLHERNTESSSASLYNTILFIDEQGRIAGKHRKLIPTGGERLIWARGGGDTLDAFDMPVGRVGGLICWEMFMPLARTAMYSQGVQILAAPTWDKSSGWMIAMQHAAREGGCFVISCCMALKKEDIPDTYTFKKLYPTDREWISKGNSCIIGPNGKIIAGPLENSKDLLIAEIDLSRILAAKRLFDVSGHYARPDVFRLQIQQDK